MLVLSALTSLKPYISLSKVAQNNVTYLFLIDLLAHSCQQSRNGSRHCLSLVRLWMSGCQYNANGYTWKEYSWETASDKSFQKKRENLAASTWNFARYLDFGKFSKSERKRVKIVKQINNVDSVSYTKKLPTLMNIY